MALTLNGTSGIVGAGIGTLDSSGANVTGVVTATSFVGSGANLTSLPAANLTGALPAISGANLTGITGTTINSNADNRIITGSGTANTLNGESNLTFDGSTLSYSASGAEKLRIKSGGGVGISTDKIHNASSLNIAGATKDYTNASTDLMDAGGLIFQGTNNTPSTGQSYPGIFWTGNTESLGRARAGILGVARSNNDATDLVFIAKVNAGGAGIHPADEKMRILNGGGITFNGDTATANALDDYEEGQWTPGYSDGSSHVNTGSSAHKYIKIGNQVTIFGNVRTNANNVAGTAAFYLNSIPFTSANFSNMFWNGTLMGDNGWNDNTIGLVSQISSNSSLLRFWKTSAHPTVGNVTLNNLGNSVNIMYSITYQAA